VEVEIIKYHENLQKIWDDFIPKTANGTFLHLRKYMDYHSDRFDDYSLMFYNGARLIGVLPAHKIQRDIYSHNGLTYGDFLFSDKIKLEVKIQILKTAFLYLIKNNFKFLHIKSIPYVFQNFMGQDNAFLYYKFDAKLTKILPFFVLDKATYKLSQIRKKSINRTKNWNLKIEQNKDFLPDFWHIVEDNLSNRYKAKPVHSLGEMRLLMNRFSENIKLYTIFLDNELISGALVYLFKNTLHFQYVHSIENNKKRMATDVMINEIIKQNIDNYNFISIGSSEVGDGQINKGLGYWKESFGSKLINQYFYSFDLQNIDVDKQILV